MNKAILIGRLTKDPEMRTTNTGVAVTSFTIAVNRPYVDQSGVKTADFFNCVAWRRLAENITKYCFKGTQVAVEGRIQNRNYEVPDGTKRYITEIVCDNVTFLSPKGDNPKNPVPNEIEPTPKAVETTDVSEDPFKDFGEEIALSEDDLPF